MKKKEMKTVNHAEMDYAPFRKNFYIESRDSKRTPQVPASPLLYNLSWMPLAYSWGIQVEYFRY